MGHHLTSAQAAEYPGLNIYAFRRVARDIPRTGRNGSWLYTRADLDTYIEAVRIRPGDLAHLGKPNQGGRYRRL